MQLSRAKLEPKCGMGTRKRKQKDRRSAQSYIHVHNIQALYLLSSEEDFGFESIRNLRWKLRTLNPERAPGVALHRLLTPCLNCWDRPPKGREGSFKLRQSKTHFAMKIEGAKESFVALNYAQRCAIPTTRTKLLILEPYHV